MMVHATSKRSTFSKTNLEKYLPGTFTFIIWTRSEKDQNGRTHTIITEITEVMFIISHPVQL